MERPKVNQVHTKTAAAPARLSRDKHEGGADRMSLKAAVTPRVSPSNQICPNQDLDVADNILISRPGLIKKVNFRQH